MSLESKIESLTASVDRLILVVAQLNQNPAPAAQAIPPIVAAVAPPVVQAPPPVLPTTAAATAPSPVMPPLPVFTAPAAPVAPAGVPFSDGKGLIAFVMDAYKAMGAAKGAKIQDVLTGVGIRNINDAQPGHYPAIYAGVEALKAAA